MIPMSANLEMSTFPTVGFRAVHAQALVPRGGEAPINALDLEGFRGLVVKNLIQRKNPLAVVEYGSAMGGLMCRNTFKLRREPVPLGAERDDFDM